MSMHARTTLRRPLEIIICCAALLVLTATAPAQLAGTYTVDSTLPTGGNNFANLTDCVAALVASGVGAPVTIELVQNTPADFTTGMPWRQPLAVAGGAWAVSASAPEAILTLDHFAGTSPTKRIVFRTAPTSPIQPVVFDCGVNGVGVGIYFQGADYVTIENIDIRQAAFDGIVLYAEDSLFPFAPSHAIMESNTIRRCRIHDCQGTAITLFGNPEQPNHTTIENNVFFDNLQSVSGFGANLARFGHISVRRAANTIVRHNSFFQGVPATTTAGGLAPCFIGSNSNDGTALAVCSANVFQIGTGGSLAAGFYHWISNPFLSNIPTTGPGYDPAIARSHDRNVYFANGPLATFARVGSATIATFAAYQSATGLDGLSLVADPGFVAPQSGDLDLGGPTSPCVDLGLPNGGPYDDIHGAVRLGTAADCGADEAPTTGLAAAFHADVLRGPCPLSVTFSDASVTNGGPPITSWAWDFDGDSVIDDTSQNPTFVYHVPGAYAVTLTVGDGTTQSSITRTAFIRAENYPLVVTSNLGDITITSVPQAGAGAATVGYTLVSGTPGSTPVGGGAFLGINFDLLTYAVIVSVPSPGNPLAFLLGIPGIFPGTDAPVPFALPGGVLYVVFPIGTVLDFVGIYLDAGGGFVLATNVARITVN